MIRIATLGTILILAGAAADAPPATAAPTRSCGNIAFSPQSEDGVFMIRARGTTCRVARRVARAARHTSSTRGPFRYRAVGFTCRGAPPSFGIGANWRCVRRTARVTFVRG